MSGESTVDTRMQASASDRSPPYMPHHMKLTTPTGTQYSSVAPVTRLGSLPKMRLASACATTGITTIDIPSTNSMSLGWRNWLATERKLLLSEPWNVMMANRMGTACSVTPNTCGNSTPASTHTGAMRGM